MESRIKHLFGPSPPVTLPADYVELCTSCALYLVSRAVARAIERRLMQEPQPQWIVFRDLAGARHRVRTELVRHLSESTREQRRLYKGIQRQRRSEELEDREPGDEELGI
jgi:uncharacterized membrane protein YccC